MDIRGSPWSVCCIFLENACNICIFYIVFGGMCKTGGKPGYLSEAGVDEKFIIMWKYRLGSGLKSIYERLYI